MKSKMKKPLLTAWLAAVALLCGAQAEPRPNISPALWVVKDADTTIYLFGTFHLLDGKSDWFNDEVKTAFDESKEVYLEALLPENPAEMQPMIMKYAMDPSGRSLSNRLPPDAKAKLEKLLAKNGMPAGMAAFDSLKPFMVEMTLATLAAMKIGVTGEQGAEKTLTTAAKARGIPVHELENLELQFKIMDGVPEKEQIAQLVETIEKFDSFPEDFGKMMKAWATGDTDGLVKILNEGLDGSPATYKALFSERNANWTKWIKSRLEQPGKVFVAVGAGHLAGKDSVPQLLEAQGIKVTRVPQAR
jgi:uncharacterized protein YbaP (TraB family)